MLQLCGALGFWFLSCVAQLKFLPKLGLKTPELKFPRPRTLTISAIYSICVRVKVGTKNGKW